MTLEDKIPLYRKIYEGIYDDGIDTDCSMKDISWKEINSGSDSDVDMLKAIHTKEKLSKVLAKNPIPFEYYKKLQSKKIKLSRFGNDIVIVE